jgi:hypothetical protein
MSTAQRAGLLRLPSGRDSDGTTQYNTLKQGHVRSPSCNDPTLGDPFGSYVLTTFVKDTSMGLYEAAKRIPGVSGRRVQARTDSASNPTCTTRSSTSTSPCCAKGI